MKNHLLDYDPSWNNTVLPENSGTVPTTDVNPETGKALTWLEKLIGVADKGVNVVNKYKSGEFSTDGTGAGTTPQDEPQSDSGTFLGMPKMVGIGVTVGVVALVGFAIWKMNKK
jgi:hypothetical protein